jgi:hypothetical protein
MCAHCEDFLRTVSLLGALGLYAEAHGADQDFIDIVGPSLAVSLPEPPPGLITPGYGPNEGPEYPGQGW